MDTIESLQPALKNFYPAGKAKEQMNQPKHNPAETKRAAAKKMILAKTLHEHGGKTFDSKVEWVKKHMPEVTNAEAFVAAALREAGEIK